MVSGKWGQDHFPDSHFPDIERKSSDAPPEPLTRTGIARPIWINPMVNISRRRLANYTNLCLQQAYRGVFGDRRVRMRDLASVPAEHRIARSNTIQFFSAVDNIGNYLPVMAIQRHVNEELDCWNIHHRNIDFDFINRHYNNAIIGGAGLLHKCFAPFWRRFERDCNLPFIVWGVGACVPDNDAMAPSDVEIARRVLRRSELVNVRDDLTANLFELPDVHISACPTLSLLSDSVTPPDGNKRAARRLLYSHHSDLLPAEETQRFAQRLRDRHGTIEVTNNTQTMRHGLWDIIDRYNNSSVVVTTRLHGAIIAWAMKVPFVALARDAKLDAFGRLYAPGNVTRCMDTAVEMTQDVSAADTADARKRVESFARRAVAWLGSPASSSTILTRRTNTDR